MITDVVHRVLCSGASVPGVQALIEVRLGVKTTAEPAEFGKWAVYFDAPTNTDLGFLIPNVLPPVKS